MQSKNETQLNTQKTARVSTFNAKEFLLTSAILHDYRVPRLLLPLLLFL